MSSEAGLAVPSGAPAGQNSPRAMEDASVWTAFARARHASEFCVAWLTLQCRQVPGATLGMLLLYEEAAGHYAPAAIWPSADRDVSGLGKTAERALAERRGIVAPGVTVPGQAATVQVAYPIEIKGRPHGVVVIDTLAGAGADLQAVLRQLHWGAGWIEALLGRRQIEESGRTVARTSFGLDLLAAASEQRGFEASATALATEIATRLECRRVSFGLLKRNGVALAAISHSATFEEKSHVISVIENAMEEALDQSASVSVPKVESTERRIDLAHRDLAKVSGAQSVASVMLTSAGRRVGVLTCERDMGEVFDAATIEMLESLGAIVGPMFELKAEQHRLVSGRLLELGGRGTRALLGRRRPFLKIIALAVLAGATWLAFARDEFRVASKATIEGTIQRAAVAPFEGYVASAPARAGDIVEAGQVLAALDEHDLKLEQVKWRTEREQQSLKFQDALGKHDRSAARVYSAMVDEAEAQLALVDDKIARATIRAPFRGVVISGDLTQMLGSPVERGKLLYEVAPLDTFRVVLQVDERDVPYVTVGQTGRVVLTGLSGESFPIRVTKMTPVATAVDGRNAFRIEADVRGAAPALRPGMEGIAKVAIDERPVLWIWTRSLVDWLRITLWGYLP